MEKKLIVTNRSALREKYGDAGLKKIDNAVKELIEEDHKRGVESLVCEVDSKDSMEAAGGNPVSGSSSQKSNKDAIDALCREYDPAYIMILGAPDVVPHISLVNPVISAGDPDPDVPSDLPYACDRPYLASREISEYIAPSRVVGRLPDVQGGKDVGYLVGLLKTAAEWKKGSVDSYRKFFGLSAEVWKHSTRESVSRAFGSSAGVHLSPPDGPSWSHMEWAKKSHFINCHGDVEDPNFYGEDNHSMPISHLSIEISGKAREATVVAAECCYGAELYDPNLGIPIDQAICNAYLEQGAYAYVGSTNIAYGPAVGNSAADLICQYFFREMLKGASTGRAFTQARHDFVRQSAPLDQIGMKTLAQFILLGDPSIHPVAAPTAPAEAHVLTKAKPNDRATRRQVLRKHARSLAVTTAIVREKATSIASVEMKSLLSKVPDLGFEVEAAVEIPFQEPQSPGKAKGLKRARSEGRVVLLAGRESEKPIETKILKPKKKRKLSRMEYIHDARILIAKEFGDNLEEVKEYHPR